MHHCVFLTTHEQLGESVNQIPTLLKSRCIEKTINMNEPVCFNEIFEIDSVVSLELFDLICERNPAFYPPNVFFLYEGFSYS